MAASEATTASEIKYGLRFEISDPNYLLIHVKNCLYGMDHFGSLRGHYGLQTASEVESDLVFQISDPNYLLIHMHIAYMEWTILAASEVTTPSKQPRSSSLI